MVDKNPVLVALLLLLSLGISTAQAQQQQGQEPYFGLFRWGVMVNALHNPYATNNMHSGVDLEIHVPKVPLFFGLGASYYYSRDTDRRWLREGEVRDWANVGGGSLFVGVKPWETGHHCIGLSGGYALAFDVHPLDTQTLIGVFQQLLDLGATLVVIEHDLDIIANSDYVIDLGPGGGEEGGTIVAQGTPGQVAANPASVTGRYLSGVDMIDKSRVRGWTTC